MPLLVRPPRAYTPCANPMGARSPWLGAERGRAHTCAYPAVMASAPARGYDYDWLVIGSGFGGSVSALRLAEKGYKVGVLECGKRFRDRDFARSAWNRRRYVWMPRRGMRGIFRMTLFKDVFIVSGSGVGGGSLGYANTLYRARPGFFADQQWEGLAEWEEELRPHYATAERMLGVTEYEGMTPADELLREYGQELGVG